MNLTVATAVRTAMSQWPLVKSIFGTSILPIIIPAGPFFLGIYIKSRDEFVGMPH